jgi:cell division protein FtsW
LPVRLSNRTYAGTRQVAVRELGFDQPLLWVVVALLAWGLVMVYSASIALPDNPRFANYAHTHFALRHGIFIAIGLVAAMAHLPGFRCGPGSSGLPGCLRSRWCCWWWC